MTDKEKKLKAKEFAADWSGKGYEKGETSRFWIDLLDRVYGVENAANYIEFEKQIKLENGNQGFIDGYIPSVKVLIEQKGSHVDLRKPEKQSDGTFLTPYQQSRRYENEILKDEQPDWIILCNFTEFIVYDMRVDKKSPVLEFTLDNLPKVFSQLDFLVDKNFRKVINEVDISIAAGKLVSEMYDAFLEQYDDPQSPENLRSLNVLCVRLVFCFYAEDAGVFKGSNLFGKYLDKFRGDLPTMRRTLIELFKHLDTPEAEWDKYDTELNQFPYVNGGLFDKKLNITIPPFNEKIAEIIIDKASYGFDWAGISPTIFGAVFESTLNPETRRSGGMHYTSIENIHKVIDPLFLDDLKAKLSEILTLKQSAAIRRKVSEFQKELSELTFLDPACGSGNFLTETYLSLRRLENKALAFMHKEQIVIETGDIIKVSIGQFYGIEVNDFAVSVAKTALWIAESQMMRETEEIVQTILDFLPLKTSATILERNALRLDWADVVPPEKLNYIMGNPPFVGFKFATKQQKDDMQCVFDGKIKPALLDFVCGWYEKAAEYIKGTKCEVAFVSTNSITQGQMAGDLWSHLFETYQIHINFAWRSFVWSSQSNDEASVHVVIIGFADFAREKKFIYTENGEKQVENISPYIIEGENIIIKSRKTPISDVPQIVMGNQAMDGGNLIIEAKDYPDFVKKEPAAIPYIKRYMMGYEFINNKPRYCLWLTNCSPAELKKMPLVYERVSKVREMRLASNDAGARKKADTPALFREQRNPKKFIAIPITSSENRKYIPIGYLDEKTIAGNTLFIVENTELYHFGVLTSSAHMAWMRTVGARMKSDYRYSKDIVYNNFPWCEPTPEQKSAIEQTAQAILDARALYPDCSLADLYDETVMPPELRKAHENNDKAVMKAYGFSPKMSEQEIVAELMKMYEKLDGEKK